MPPTRAIYKPVSGGEDSADGQEGRENDVVIFTIDGFDDDDDDDDNLASGEHYDDHYDHDRLRKNGMLAFEMEAAQQPMDVSSHSFSDDDFSEQLFGWKDPWLPSIAIALLFTTPVLLGNACMFHELTGAWFFATPFVLHLILVLSAARHFVATKLTALSTFKSRMFTSVASL